MRRSPHPFRKSLPLALLTVLAVLTACGGPVSTDDTARQSAALASTGGVVLDLPPDTARQSATLVGTDDVALDVPPGDTSHTTALASTDEVVLYASDFRTVGTHWSLVSDASAVAGRALSNAGGVLTAVSATPSSYAEATFFAEAGRTYYVWIRARGDAPGNFSSDAFWVQFDQSTTPAGEATVRIGTTSAAPYNGYAALTGYNWLGGDATNDNENIPPLAVRFATSGAQTLRLQSRQAPLRIDEVWLSTTQSTRPVPQDSVRLKDPATPDGGTSGPDGGSPTDGGTRPDGGSPTDAGSGADLWVSAVASRDGAVPLAGRTVQGSVYIFAAARAGVSKVDFFLDGAFQRSEANAPYDFAGGTDTTARPFDTAALSNGAHTVRALYTFTSGSTFEAQATFITANGSGPDGGTGQDAGTPGDGGTSPDGGAIVTPVLTTSGNRFLLDGAPFDMWGIRVGSASQSQANTDHLLAQLDDYRAHGVNTVTVFYQGSSGGASDPFSPDGLSVNAAHHARMERILRAAAERDMVVVVGIFYQRAPFGLQSAEAVRNAVRTVTRLLRPYRHVIINIANEQNSTGWDDVTVVDFNDPQTIIQLCGVVHQEDPSRLAGGGGYDHTRNLTIGRSPEVNALLFDTNGPEDSGALHDNFVAGGVTNKPIVNVELFGAWSRTSVRGVFPDSMKAEYLAEVQRAAARPGLSVFFHSNSWCQELPNRYDLAGQGTPADPGMRWYFEAVADALGLNP